MCIHLHTGHESVYVFVYVCLSVYTLVCKSSNVYTRVYVLVDTCIHMLYVFIHTCTWCYVCTIVCGVYGCVCRVGV